MAYISFQPKDYFTTHLYSGNDTTNNQQVGLTPDLVWVKCRNNATPSHYWVDKVRGDKKYISSNATTAEQTDSNTFDLVSGGFNLAGGNGWTNVTGRNYASWNWLANGQGSSNTDGSITTTVSANTTSGFSIVKFTATGSAATIGHGLSTVPKMILVKRTDSSHTWQVYHASIGATKYLELNETQAEATSSGRWNDTTPTNSVFSIGSEWGSGAVLIAYCFSDITGFSKTGLYEGNGNADGAFIYTGFKPAFVLYKGKGAVQSWNINDNKRLGYNPNNAYLFPNLTQAESDITRIDLLSNGFKLRTTDAGQNGSGQGYIYIAFAEEPLVSSNGVPATAR